MECYECFGTGGCDPCQGYGGFADSYPNAGDGQDCEPCGGTGECGTCDGKGETAEDLTEEEVL